jgi:surface carbohydrate biosynthesis protein
VVVGQQWAIFAAAPTMPTGAVLFKTANAIQTGLMRSMSAHGHRVVAMDEEALAVVDPLAMRISTDPAAFDIADAFLYQDAHHREVFGQPGSIVGSARVELLRKYRALYTPEPGPPYILVNTNYTLSNSIWGSPERQRLVLERAWAPRMSEAGAREYVDGLLAAETANLEAMRGFIAEMRHPRIVVRPHPGEDASTWQGQGLEVVAGSNPIPWMLGADLVVHSQSTTGVEAALLGVPCLNINPVPESHLSRSMVTNGATFQAHDAATAVDMAYEALAGFADAKDASWLPEYPENAAAAIAREIAAVAVTAPRITDWTPHPRSDVQRQKFTVPWDYARERMRRVCEMAGTPPVRGGQLDDSLFWFGA